VRDITRLGEVAVPGQQRVAHGAIQGTALMPTNKYSICMVGIYININTKSVWNEINYEVSMGFNDNVTDVLPTPLSTIITLEIRDAQQSVA
jgi:hypothetical protein